jgi:hypothetical protein
MSDIQRVQVSLISLSLPNTVDDDVSPPHVPLIVEGAYIDDPLPDTPITDSDDVLSNNPPTVDDDEG